MHFLEKKYRKTDGDLINLHLCTKNLDDMIYSSWHIERDRLKFEILGHFLPFYLPPSKFWKNEKNCWRCHHFTHVYQKSQSYDMVPEMRSDTDRLFCHLGPFCALLPIRVVCASPQSAEWKFWENEKNNRIYYWFTLVYHKWQSYHV